MAFSARLARAALRSSAISRRSFAYANANKLTDDDFSPEQLKYNFFNMPLLQSKIDIATKHGAYDHATYRAAFTDAVEEKIEKYEPEIKPEANQLTFSAAQLNALVADQSDAIKAAVAEATKAGGNFSVELPNASGLPLNQLFVEELALLLSRAAISTGSSDPAAFVKGLYGKDFPANFGETLAMDALVALHGQTRATAVPFSEQIDVKYMTAVEGLIAPQFAQANWAAKVSNYMYECAAASQRTQKKLHTPDYYSMFYAFFPALVAFIVFTYWEEFHHISHARHEQHERVEALLKEL